ncbi:MAG: hypothetical protein QOD74_2071 [Variibacter sp.]|jgi:hypothetical protein|nr:hypothetical protein [Variibacter sp.]
MRILSAALAASLVLATGVSSARIAEAVPTRSIEFSSREAVLGWINGYRAKPDLARVPLAVRSLSQLGAFKDVESSAVFVGFIAGVLGANPKQADELVSKMLPLRPDDQWFLVRAIAYSGLPQWKAMLTRFRPQLAARTVMIDKYLEGKLPTLTDLSLDDGPGFWSRAGEWVRVDRYFTGNKPAAELKLRPSGDLIDLLWGYYFATGAYSPVSKLIAMLPWSKDRDVIEKLTLGNMAKYTLAINASRNVELLAMLKWAAPQQAKDTQPILKEVIEAADLVDTIRLRNEALAAMEELKRKGPGYKRDVSWWASVGQGAVSLGCIGAAVAGQVEFGIPCVVGGALSSAVLNYWGQTDK